MSLFREKNDEDSQGQRGFKKGILIVVLFFALIVLCPSVSGVADFPSEGQSGGGGTVELSMPENLGLGALGVDGIVVVAQTLDDGGTGGMPAQGAH